MNEGVHSFHTCEIHWRNGNIYLLLIQCLIIKKGKVNCQWPDYNEK